MPLHEKELIAKELNCSVQQLEETDSLLVARAKAKLQAEKLAPTYHRTTMGGETVH